MCPKMLMCCAIRPVNVINNWWIDLIHILLYCLWRESTDLNHASLSIKFFLPHILDSVLKFLFQIKKGSSKKFPMNAAPMSRYTNGAYFRSYLEKRQKIKKEFMHLRVIQYRLFNVNMWLRNDLLLQTLHH